MRLSKSHAEASRKPEVVAAGLTSWLLSLRSSPLVGTSHSTTSPFSFQLPDKLGHSPSPAIPFSRYSWTCRLEYFLEFYFQLSLSKVMEKLVKSEARYRLNNRWVGECRKSAVCAQVQEDTPRQCAFLLVEASSLSPGTTSVLFTAVSKVQRTVQGTWRMFCEYSCNAPWCQKPTNSLSKTSLGKAMNLKVRQANSNKKHIPLKLKNFVTPI